MKESNEETEVEEVNTYDGSLEQALNDYENTEMEAIKESYVRE